MKEYFFLFTCGLDITDLQFAELGKLLRICSQPRQLDAPIFFVGRLPPNVIPKAFYIRKFSQSCIVYTENSLDLENIIRRSGYIHSCGFHILHRAWDEVEPNHLVQRIVSYCQQEGYRYKVEFYTGIESIEAAEAMRNTLIDRNRYFIGRSLLNQKIPDLQQEIAHQLDRANILRPAERGAIFIIRDIASIPEEGKPMFAYPGKQDLIFMIIYYSLYVKRDALKELDEDKPFWAGIFTTPQDLTAAMLNLAEVDETSRVLDPFSHQGTTSTEAAKLGAWIYYSDWKQIRGTADNVRLLVQLLQDERDRIIQQIKQIMKPEPKTDPQEKQRLGILSENLRRLAQEKIKDPPSEGAFPEMEPIEAFFKDNSVLLDILPNRICFHIFRRFYVRYHDLPLIERHAPVVNSSQNLLEKIDKYNQNLKRSDFNPGDPLPTIRICAQPSSASRYCEFSANARDIPLKNNSIDAIVTDPPFGYGSDTQDEELLETYEKFLQQAFRVLKPRGWLAMCLLDKVKTGKSVSPQLQTEVVVEMADRIAHEEGISFIHQEDGYPAFKPYRLFYWKSKHALNRAILVVQIDKASRPS